MTLAHDRYDTTAIRSERQRRGWMQSTLAAHAGVGLRVVARVEDGRHFSVRSLSKVAGVLGLDIEAMYRSTVCPTCGRAATTGHEDTV